MIRRCTLSILAFVLCLLSASHAQGRGGETGTLEEDPYWNSLGTRFISDQDCLPYYLSLNHFRRLQARLKVMQWAPLPGWKGQRVWRMRDRYFTEDGRHEILPRDPEPIF